MSKIKRPDRSLKRMATNYTEILEAYADYTDSVLAEIAEGRGRYDIDPLRHASNTIEDMRKLAMEALSKE